MFDKLKRLFVLEEEGKKTPVADKDQVDQTEEEVPQTVQEVVESSFDSIEVEPNAKPDDKFINILLKAIEDNNLEGFDYLEYKQSIQSLASMNMDSETQYKSSMAMARTMGATPKKLIDSANHYMQVLEKEKNRFSQAVEVQRKKVNDEKTVGLKNLETSIKTKEEQIAKLQTEIAQLTEKLKVSETEIKQNAAKIETTNKQFMIAYRSVMDQITEDVQNMNKYLA